MKRRSFLKFAGCACSSAFLGNNVSSAGNSGADAAYSGMLVNRSLLQNRNQNRSTVVCQNGIVCSSQPLASMAGVDILKAGSGAGGLIGHLGIHPAGAPAERIIVDVREGHTSTIYVGNGAGIGILDAVIVPVDVAGTVGKGS